MSIKKAGFKIINCRVSKKGRKANNKKPILLQKNLTAPQKYRKSSRVDWRNFFSVAQIFTFFKNDKFLPKNDPKTTAEFKILVLIIGSQKPADILGAHTAVPTLSRQCDSIRIGLPSSDSILIIIKCNYMMSEAN